MKKKFVYFSILSFMFLLVGCKDKSNLIDETLNNKNEIEVGVSDNNISGDIKKDNYSLVNDISFVTEEIDNTYTETYGSDVDTETITNIEYELEKLTFGDWGFEISIPKSLVNDYKLINNMSEVNISSSEEFNQNYVLSNDNCVQIFNLDEKYFGIFVDTDVYSEDWQKAIDENMYDYIKQIIPSNNFYSYLDINTPMTTIYGDNAILVKFPVLILPTSNNELSYEGYVGYLTIDNNVYYILYGENKLYDATLKDNIYSDVVYSSIHIKDELIKNNNVEETIESNINNEFINKIKKEDLPDFPTLKKPNFDN